nr:immunoglobulin light chain junction region [Macaca mulatta]MOV61037.1 immunoglobulin light chain junction region [Macaca mulatta]MOV61090.1 immunoglobulin light chain junction region [Macaca mulatta]MOV61135.1 immunoglobulin light chain junction region [Macaca mulatta]MOV61229.1 immunoglobulin light chain junction region [Macaca mulatta]
CYQYFSGYTF